MCRSCWWRTARPAPAPARWRLRWGTSSTLHTFWVSSQSYRPSVPDWRENLLFVVQVWLTWWSTRYSTPRSSSLQKDSDTFSVRREAVVTPSRPQHTQISISTFLRNISWTLLTGQCRFSFPRKSFIKLRKDYFKEFHVDNFLNDINIVIIIRS